MNAGGADVPAVEEILPPAFNATYFAAALLGEPFHLAPDELAKLTDRQIFDLYFYPRDEKTGALKPPVTYLPDEMTKEQLRAVWFSLGRSVGKSDEELTHQWEEKYGRDHDEGQQPA